MEVLAEVNKSIDRTQFDNHAKGSMVIYRGTSFTLAISWADIFEKGKHRRIVAEGVARRSHLDSPLSSIGDSIALGRSDKALSKKLKGKVIHNVLMG